MSSWLRRDGRCLDYTDMTTLEEQIKSAAEKAVLHNITKGGWIENDYRNRLKIPGDLLQEVWSMVDRDKLKACLKERIERELADRLVNHIAAEMATDIKQILSVPERREAVRALAREHMNSVMGA